MKKLLITFLSFSVFSFAQKPNYKQFDNFLDLLSQNEKIMASIAISKDSKIEYKKSVGYGYINYKSSQKASSESKYKIGSITKTFTAVMIFQLIEEGKISLETKLSEFYKNIPNASKISIFNLLTHSSGLYNLTNADEFGSWKNKPSTTEEMLARIAKFEIDFQPDEKNNYSNTNFLLLGYIIESLDKVSYGEALKNRIVDKLGLKNTYYGGAINTNANECHSYNYKNELWLQSEETNMTLPGGAGAIVSNPTDLLIFINALFNSDLISTASLKEMTTVDDNDFCKGIFHNQVQGLTIYGHDGGIDGFQSMLVYMPKSKTAIALTANALNYSKKKIMFNALYASMGKPLELPNFSRIELTEDEIIQYAGVYESNEVPYDLVFEANGKILKGAPEGSNLKDLIPVRKNEFSFEALGITLNFNLKEHTVLFKRPNNEPILFTKKQ